MCERGCGWISPCEEVGIRQEIEKLKKQIELLNEDTFKNDIFIQQLKEELIEEINKRLKRIGK